MKKKWLLAAALLVLVGSSYGNLIKNGGFEDPFEGSWDTLVRSNLGNWNFSRWDTMGQPTPGFAARAYKYLQYSASLLQVVDVPDVNQVLSFDARFRMGGGSSTCWPTAAFVVRYLDASGGELGNTKYYKHDQYNNWTNNDTAHLIDVSAAEGWNHYQLDIAQELAENLPGVNAAMVGKVQVELYPYDHGT